MSEDTKLSGIVLEDLVSRLCAFFSSTSRVMSHQGSVSACLAGLKNQSKSELTFMQYVQPEDQDPDMSWEDKDVHGETNCGILSKTVLVLSRNHIQVLGSQLRDGTQDLQIWNMVLLTSPLLERTLLQSCSETFKIYPNAIFSTVDDHSPVDCQRILCCDCFNILSLQTLNVQINCQITLI